jgi:pyrroloquinoline quinone (PQQ) biosynthesis protein C
VSTTASLALFERIAALIADYRAKDGWTKYSGSRLTRAGAALYAQQHGIFTRHSRRVWAYVVGNCPEVEFRRFVVKENLYEEEGLAEISHYLKLVRLGQKLGLSAEEMDDAPALPTTRAALLIWETLTKDRHWLIGAAAKGALEFRNTSGLEGERWMKTLGLSRDDVQFWMMHHEIDAVHGTGAYDLVMKYLPDYPEITDDAILTAVEDSMSAWMIFRNGVAAAAEQR